MKKLISTIFCTHRPERDIKNANRVNLWAIAWALTLLIITVATKQGWLNNNVLIASAFIVHSAIGLKMVFAYKHHLKELDEMERKIQLDALAMSVGSAIICFSSYSILAKADIVPPLAPNYLIILIALTYIVGIFVGRVRYS